MTRTALYTHQYFDISPGHARRPKQAIRWREGLPEEWANQVVAPLYFDHYLDYQIAAARILGRDEDDRACYCAHSYVLESREGIRAATVTYAQSMRAWRLRNGRWLVDRIIVSPGATDGGHRFFSLSPEMPA